MSSMLFLLLACRTTTIAPDGGAPVLALANCVGTMLFDVGVDSIADGIWVFTYNNQGEPSSAVYDSKADGTEDSRMDYVYESDLLASRLWDGDNNGVVDTETTYFYDLGNYLLESREDQGVDGVAEKRSVWELEDGLKQVQRNMSGESLEDVTEEGYYSWEETENGEFYQVSMQWHPTNNTGDALVTYTYNDQWLAITEEIDQKMDGMVDQREIYTWDEQGRKLITDKDTNADGIADYRSSWTYVCDQ